MLERWGTQSRSETNFEKRMDERPTQIEIRKLPNLEVCFGGPFCLSKHMGTDLPNIDSGAIGMCVGWFRNIPSIAISG